VPARSTVVGPAEEIGPATLERGTLRRGPGQQSDQRRASLRSGVSCGTFSLAGVAVELAEQDIAVFFRPFGEVLDEVLDLFTGGLSKCFHTAEVGRIALNEVWIELFLADHAVCFSKRKRS